MIHELPSAPRAGMVMGPHHLVFDNDKLWSTTSHEYSHYCGYVFARVPSSFTQVPHEHDAVRAQQITLTRRGLSVAWAALYNTYVAEGAQADGVEAVLDELEERRAERDQPAVRCECRGTCNGSALWLLTQRRSPNDQQTTAGMALIFKRRCYTAGAATCVMTSYA
jgi:hypothetical protein